MAHDPLAIGDVVLKNIFRNRRALPQSFELSTSAEKYGTFYKHRAARYAPDLRIDRRNCKCIRKVVSRKDVDTSLLGT
ncbi:hypothetical protein TNCV_3637021 [Trichonephila clavipes]|nr:hypothetical protein TNCV_3637021 [Trichonephila clavipes]